MKSGTYVFSIMMALCLFLAGCGEDKTIYENAGTTPSTDSEGKILFSDKCSGCHTASSLTGTTVVKIKDSNMAYGLTDAQLQLVVEYLAAPK